MRKMSLVIVVLAALGLMIFGGLFKLNSQKAETPNVPVSAQTSESSKDAPSASPSATDEDSDEVDMTNYKVHKLPEDSDTWTDQEWEWYATAAVNFHSDYVDIFVNNFGEEPSEEAVNAAQNFAEEVCTQFDKGRTVDDIAEGIVDSGGSQKTQAALALAVKPGTENFCPWNLSKL